MDTFILNIVHRPEMVPEYTEYAFGKGGVARNDGSSMPKTRRGTLPC